MVERMSFADWCRQEGKEELLALFDERATGKSAEEWPRSGSGTAFWRCGVCGESWKGSTNKAKRRSRGAYNVIFKRDEVTYCPYCKGERVSKRYNYATEHPEVARYWDYQRNDSCPASPSEPYEVPASGSTAKAFLKCGRCEYEWPEPISLKGLVKLESPFACPMCEGGSKRRMERADHNLALEFPTIAQEYVVEANGGVDPARVSSSSRKEAVFRCPRCRSLYRSRINNRTYLGRGCPHCSSRKTTSFSEQALFFYIKRSYPRAQNDVLDDRSGERVDVLIAERRSVIEFNSLYMHAGLNSERVDRDKEKLLGLARFYRVFVVMEPGLRQKYASIEGHPLITFLEVPLFSPTKQVLRAYDEAILRLLILIDPDQAMLPRIDTDEDSIAILNALHAGNRGEVEGNFQEEHPLLAMEWDTVKNGNLNPRMFKSSSPYRFFWKCPRCGRGYRASLSNRVRTVHVGSCSHCFRGSPRLVDRYPIIKLFWSEPFNREPLEEVMPYSEKERILRLSDSTVVALKPNLLFAWLESHEGAAFEEVEDYLVQVREKQERDMRGRKA